MNIIHYDLSLKLYAIYQLQLSALYESYHITSQNSQNKEHHEKTIYTEKQLHKMGYKPTESDKGVKLWTNGYCEHSSVYYDIANCVPADETKEEGRS